MAGSRKGGLGQEEEGIYGTAAQDFGPLLPTAIAALTSIPEAVYRTGKNIPQLIGEGLGLKSNVPTDYGTNVSLDVLAEGLQKMRDIGMNPLRDAIAKNFNMSPAPTPAEPAAPTSTTPQSRPTAPQETVTQSPAPVAVPTVAPGQFAHLEKYNNIYDVLRALPDEKFKQFVDKNQNDNVHGIPGVGYITSGNKMIRVIEDPANRPPETVTMGLKEAQALGQIYAGIGQRENARAATELAHQDRQDAINASNKNREEATNLRRDQGVDAMIKTIGTTMDQTTGQAVFNPSAAMLKLAVTGYDPNSLPEHWKPVYQAEVGQFDQYVKEAIKRNPKMQDTPQTRKALLAYYLNPPK